MALFTKLINVIGFISFSFNTFRYPIQRTVQSQINTSIKYFSFGTDVPASNFHLIFFL